MKKGQLITTPTDTRIYKPKGFKGSITGPAAKLYTKEDIKNMTNKEFEEKEKEIMEQIKTIYLQKMNFIIILVLFKNQKNKQENG